MSTKNILTGLSKLDSDNNDHWDLNGKPRLEALQSLMGNKHVTQDDLTAAAPDFTRETATLVVNAESIDHTKKESAEEVTAKATFVHTEAMNADEVDLVIDPIDHTAPKKAEADFESYQANSREDHDSKIEAKRKAFEKMAATKAKTDAAYAAHQAELDDAINAKAATEQPEMFATSFQNYLAYEQKKREEAQAQADKLRKSGVNLNELRKITNTRSPLDVALANKKK